MSISRRQLLVSGAGLAVSGALGSFGSANVWGQPAARRVGLALTIGLDKLSRNHYSPLPVALASCVNDAKAMERIAKNAGFTKVIPLHNENATRFEVCRHIYHASQRLKAGDLFLVTISSHGFTGAVGETADQEEDGKDEGWCLYDWMMVDDEAYSLWQLFQPGVRILAIADTCHAGTSAKLMNYAKSLGMNPNQPPVLDAEPKGPPLNPKSLPPGLAKNLGSVLGLPEDSPAVTDVFYPAKSLTDEEIEGTYQKGKADYDAVLGSVLSHLKSDAAMTASGLLIASSQDHQSSFAGNPYSAFTRELVEVWKNPPGSYRDLFTAILGRLRWQTPNWYPFGVLDPQFHSQRPFTV